MIVIIMIVFVFNKILELICLFEMRFTVWDMLIMYVPISSHYCMPLHHVSLQYLHTFVYICIQHLFTNDCSLIVFGEQLYLYPCFDDSSR